MLRYGLTIPIGSNGPSWILREIPCRWVRNASPTLIRSTKFLSSSKTLPFGPAVINQAEVFAPVLRKALGVK